MLRELRDRRGRDKEAGPRRGAPEQLPARASLSPCPGAPSVDQLWLGILPRFARRKDLNFGVLVLGET